MAAHARRSHIRKRRPRREAEGGGFITSLPEDENWIDALRDELDDRDAVASTSAVGAAKDVSRSGWPALHEALDQQGELIRALTVKVESLEASLVDALRRPAPVASPPAPSGPTPVRRAVRECFAALRQHAVGSALRVQVDMARGGRRRRRG